MDYSRAALRAVTLAVLVLLVVGTGTATAGEGVGYVLVVDNTGSMRYERRGEMTLEAVREFVDLMRPGDRVSAYCYGEKVVPLLKGAPVLISGEGSKARVRDELSLTFTDERTDITLGLERVWLDRERLFADTGSSSDTDRHAVVLLSDGKLVPVYDDFSEYDRVYRASKARLRELGDLFGGADVPIWAIGLGGEGRIDGALLADLAARSGGSYHHAAGASEVGRAFLDVMEEIEAHGPGADVASSRSAAERPEDSTRMGDGSWVRDGAFAGEPEASGVVVEERTPPQTERMDQVASASRARCGPSVLEGFPADFCTRAAAVLAVLIGVVAIGTERRHRWVIPFAGHLFGTGETRVRGYLKPVDMPGSMTARVNVGLENPGLDSIRVGVGTPYLNSARETVIEFVGTRDGSAPLLRVEKGSVKVQSEFVEERKLKDGDIIEIEGQVYQYLRGNRR